jgi:hypothetical protein
MRHSLARRARKAPARTPATTQDRIMAGIIRERTRARMLVFFAT